MYVPVPVSLCVWSNSEMPRNALNWSPDSVRPNCQFEMCVLEPKLWTSRARACVYATEPSQLFEYRLRSEVVRLHAWSLLWFSMSIAVENRAMPPLARTDCGNRGNAAAFVADGVGEDRATVPVVAGDAGQVAVDEEELIERLGEESLDREHEVARQRAIVAQ